LGKHYPASANSHDYAKSVPFSDSDTDFFSVANCIDDTIRLANINICISCSDLHWAGNCRTGKPDACANNFATSISKELRNRTPPHLNREAFSFLAG